MAFSTQKEFFHVPFMNETFDFECPDACVKLKSYPSTVDDRSWSADEDKKSRFVADLVACNAPRRSGEGGPDGGDKTPGGKRPRARNANMPVDSEGDGGGWVGGRDRRPSANAANKYGRNGNLVRSDSLVRDADDVLGRIENVLVENNAMPRRPADPSRPPDNADIKRVLDKALDSQKNANLRDKIKALAAKLPPDDSENLMKLAQGVDDMNKAYEILEAENASLKSLIDKQAKRSPMAELKIPPEKSTDIGYLQKKVNELAQELAALRKLEDEKMNGKKSGFSPDQDASEIAKVIAERDALRNKIAAMNDIESILCALLSQQPPEIDCFSNDATNNQAICDMQNDMQQMQNYYENEVEKSKYNEECLKCLCEELKQELTSAKSATDSCQCLQMEVNVLRQEIKKRDIALNAYDCQYQQLMNVICEINQKYGNQSGDCPGFDECVSVGDDLAFYTGVTLEQAMSEIAKQKDCFRRMSEEAGVKVASIDDCLEELKRLKELLQIREDQLCQTIAENKRLIRAARESAKQLAELDRRVRDLDKDTRLIEDGMRDSIDLIRDIGDVARENDLLKGKVDGLRDSELQRLLDELRRKLQDCQEKNRLLQEQNNALGDELRKLGVNPDDILKQVEQRMEEEKKEREREEALKQEGAGQPEARDDGLGIGPGGQVVGPDDQRVGPGGQVVGPDGQPESPDGQRIGPDGQPVGPEDTKGPDGQIVGPDGQPVSPDDTRGPDGQPVGPEGTKVGPDVGPDGQPVRQDGQPVGQEGQKVGPDGQKVSPDGQPVGQDDKPVGPDGHKVGEESGPSGKAADKTKEGGPAEPQKVAEEQAAKEAGEKPKPEDAAKGAEKGEEAQKKDAEKGKEGEAGPSKPGEEATKKEGEKPEDKPTLGQKVADEVRPEIQKVLEDTGLKPSGPALKPTDIVGPTQPGDAGKQAVPTDIAKPGEAIKEALKPDEAAKPGEEPRAGEAPKPGEAGKPDEAAKPGEAPKPGEAAKPGEATKPGEAPKPSEATKPGEAPKPGEAAKPGEVVKPAEGAKPSEAVKPGETPKPGEVAKPGEATKPGEAPKPGEAAKPGEVVKPAEGTKPSEAVKPGETPKPGEAAKPGEATKPGEALKPGEAAKPGEVLKPAEGTKPSEAVKAGETPKSGEAAKPGEATQPGQAPKPGEAAKPDEAPKPGEAVKPGEAPKPGEALKPGEVRPGEASAPGGPAAGAPGATGNGKAAERPAAGPATVGPGAPGAAPAAEAVPAAGGAPAPGAAPAAGGAPAPGELPPPAKAAPDVIELPGGPQAPGELPPPATGAPDVVEFPGRPAPRAGTVAPGEEAAPGAPAAPGQAGGPTGRPAGPAKPSAPAGEPGAEAPAGAGGPRPLGQPRKRPSPPAAGARGDEAGEAEEITGVHRVAKQKQKGAAMGAIDETTDQQLNEFVSKTAETLCTGEIDGVGLEMELRKILDMFIDECGFCFCKCNIPKSRFYAICHKLYHHGLHKLDFKELAYMHKRIYAAAENLLPGCLFNMIIKDMETLKGTSKIEPQKTCCSCRSALCCDINDDKLMNKVKQLEQDIENAKLCLENLKNIPSNLTVPAYRIDGGNAKVTGVQPIGKEFSMKKAGYSSPDKEFSDLFDSPSLQMRAKKQLKHLKERFAAEKPKFILN